MKKVILFSIVGFALLAVGVYKNFIGYFRYGRSFNETRLARGIPAIEDGFQHSEDYLFWYNPDKQYPRHAMKSITIDGFDIEIEQDNFEFLQDTVVITLYSYYRYKQNCYSVYMKRYGVPESRLSCEEFLELLKNNGFSQKVICTVCSE
jgi:hypothetical protein